MARTLKKLTPNQIGDNAESRAKKILGGRRVAQSGGGKWYKLDVNDDAGFIYSIKATLKITDTALRAIKKLWDETINGARGLQGHGDGAKPAMVFELEGEMIFMCRLEDHVALATGEIPPYISPEKAAVRRKRAGQNPMDRD